MTAEELIGNLLGATASKTRKKVIPPNIALEVGNFRRDLLDLEDDPGYITVLIQDVGRLAMAGQYGYVDLLNEQYIKYSDVSSPKAISFARVRVEIYQWLECIKKDFFESEVQSGDFEEAKTSVNDVEAMYMWARLTDQYEIEDIIQRIEETLEYMYSKFNYRKETCRMFNNELSTLHLREFLADLDKAEDPNADFECFCSSDLGRLGVGNVLTWWLWEKNWAPDALIEGFDEDPVTATGVSAVAPNNAHYFQVHNEGGKRVLTVMYDRPVGSLDGIPECRATYIIEFNKDLNKWQIVHAKVGL